MVIAEYGWIGKPSEAQNVSKIRGPVALKHGSRAELGRRNCLTSALVYRGLMSFRIAALTSLIIVLSAAFGIISILILSMRGKIREDMGNFFVHRVHVICFIGFKHFD